MPPIEAYIVAATFEQDIAEGYIQSVFEVGQVFEEQLFLKIFSIGGNNDAAAILCGVVNGRGEIGHGFAHACARFGDEEMVVVEGIGNGAHHFDLFGANFIFFGLSVKGAAGFKQGAEHVDVEGVAGL